MTDFHQNGNIAQFHNLRSRPIDELEYELESFAQTRKITLILPALFSELEGPALKNTIDEICKVRYLNRIVIGLDRADETQFRRAQDFFSVLPQTHSVIWNDSPRMKAIDERLRAADLGPQEQGKGKNVWTAIGYTIASEDASVVALHDCDIVTYKKDLLSRLLYPVANPSFSYQLSKGFYARVGDGRMNGRVVRLLVSPLLIALKKTVGDNDYIDYLRSFRYPLSGEMALRAGMLPDLRIPSDWGLEIGVLSEAWRNLGRHQVCQVEIADAYDHKHQDVSEGDPSGGLNRMSMDICKAVFRKMAAEGTVFSVNVFRALKATYYRRALDLLEVYDNDATMNGLKIDRHEEERTIELFADNITKAGQDFLDNPNETPFIPNWNRVHSADPEILKALITTVAEDAAEFAPIPF
ncbi:MAG: glycosyl transferase [Pseudomonadota bacterium]